jgi:hypothetical protein
MAAGDGACSAATLGAAAYALMREGFAKIMVANSANGRSPLNKESSRRREQRVDAFGTQQQQQPSYGGARRCETTCAPPRLQTACIQEHHAPAVKPGKACP